MTFSNGKMLSIYKYAAPRLAILCASGHFIESMVMTRNESNRQLRAIEVGSITIAGAVIGATFPVSYLVISGCRIFLDLNKENKK